ncbi:MAG TPA: hypothetical protein VJS19_00720, partial [Candidatus Dormibacteraeota bacterium]|nr:hypothetical protein [Candidatus Dormibacteraeota bacterium]
MPTQLPDPSEMWSYIQNFGETEAVAPRASPTWTVNWIQPDRPVNVPLSESPFSDVPAGSGPCVNVYVNGPTPPLCW